MIKLAMKIGLGAAFFAVALSTLGCGGRTNHDDDSTDTADNDGGKPTDTPPPACDTICRRAVDFCFPGAAADQCTKECETMRAEKKGCPAVDAFLRCQSTANVSCSPNHVTIEGCADERNEVARCP